MTDKPSDIVTICENVDGLTLNPNVVKLVKDKRIDDVRLKETDDILLSTYPRTGTTWLSQIVSLMMAADSDYEETKKSPLFERVLYLEFTFNENDYPEIEKLDKVPVPRALKTHLPYRFIRRWIDEDNVKSIITTRNPKDTMVSLYHFYQTNKRLNFTGTWDEFFRQIQAGKTIYGDQYEWLKDWDDNREKGQLLFLKYEAMTRDLKAEMKRIAEFLKLDVSESRMEKICQDTSITVMRSDLASNFTGFKNPKAVIRSGKLGQWKKYFTVEQNEWFDAKYKKLYENLAVDVEYDIPTL